MIQDKKRVGENEEK